MLLTPQEIKEQTRALWRTAFNDSDDFIDLYFEEKYTDDANIFFRHDGDIFAAVQAFPMRFQMGGHVLPSIYISGLATLPEYRRQGLAAQVLYYAHRRAFERGVVFSFLVPGDERLVNFYRQQMHGNYEVTTCRIHVPLQRTEASAEGIEVNEPEQYGQDVYVFYKKQQQQSAVALTLSERDFFAAVGDTELDGGALLIARRRQKIVGTCLYLPTKDGILVRDLMIAEPGAQTAFVDYLEQAYPKQNLQMIDYCKWEEEGAEPYAMARVLNVERFLTIVAAHHPEEIFEVGVEGDEQIPENNGYYRLEKGKLKIIANRPNVVLTPGAFAAAFLREHPVEMRLLMSDTVE